MIVRRVNHAIYFGSGTHTFASNKGFGGLAVDCIDYWAECHGEKVLSGCFDVSKVTQQAAEILKPRWYEKPLTFGPVCFFAGAVGGGYVVYKLINK